MTVVFRTERATIRTWRSQEALRLFDIRRRPEVARWLGDTTPWTELATAHEKIDEWATRTTDDPPCGVWAIVPDGTDVPVGTVSLGRLPNGAGEVEVGWVLHPDAVGNGWAREAAAGALVRAFEHGLEEVWAIMWPDNHRSAAVATAIGMTDLGLRDDPWYGTDEDPTSRMFRVDGGTWQATPPFD